MASFLHSSCDASSLASSRMSSTSIAPSLDERLRGEEFLLDESVSVSSALARLASSSNHHHGKKDKKERSMMEQENHESTAARDSNEQISTTPTTTTPNQNPNNLEQEPASSYYHHNNNSSSYNNNSSSNNNDDEASVLTNDSSFWDDPVLEQLILWHKTLQTFWKNHGVTCVWLLLYTFVNLCLFYVKTVHYTTSPTYETPRAVFGSCVVVAKASSNCINLNAGLILVPLLRHLWTYMRSKWTTTTCATKNNNNTNNSWAFLFDLQNSWVMVHSVIGWVFAYWTTVHVFAHGCDYYRFVHHDHVEDLVLLFPKDEELLQDSNEEQRWGFLLGQPATVSGIFMLACMLVAHVFIALKKRGYNVFWYSHHLLLVVLVVLMFHGRAQILGKVQSVYWIILPLFLYLIPKIKREIMGLTKRQHKYQVLELSIHPGNLVVLKLTKPKHWKNHQQEAGMYANLNIPLLSRLEWHPFYITSAPSDDYLEFHIQPVGDWTRRLYQLAKTLSSLSLQQQQSPPTLADIEQAIGWVPTTTSTTTTPTSTALTIYNNNSGDINHSPNTISSFTSTIQSNSPPPNDLMYSGSSNRDESPNRHHHNISSNGANSSDDAIDLQPKQLIYSEDSAAVKNKKCFPYSLKSSSSAVSFQLQDLHIKVDGPLLSGSLLQGYSQHRYVALIGSGIGIAPMISILKQVLAAAQHDDTGRVERIYLIWTFRERQVMDWFASLVNDILLLSQQQQEDEGHGSSRQPTVDLKLRFFVTSQQQPPPKVAPTTTTTTSSNTSMLLGAEEESALQVIYGQQPDWNEELRRIELETQSWGGRNCGLFVCGPSAMTQTIRATSVKLSEANPDFHFYCRQESF